MKRFTNINFALVLGFICTLFANQVFAQPANMTYKTSGFTACAMDAELNVLSDQCNTTTEDNIFVWASDGQSFVHTTPTISSTYYVKETLDNNGKPFYKVLSDADNEYYYQFSDESIILISKAKQFSVIYTIDGKPTKNKGKTITKTPIKETTPEVQNNNNSNTNTSGKRKGVWRE
ncbi:MAG: hypothetical protein SGJ04_09400 [Bacteroidota bacterium]|nr:hypothetical protein [Bacteroidota bacterium]